MKRLAGILLTAVFLVSAAAAVACAALHFATRGGKHWATSPVGERAISFQAAQGRLYISWEPGTPNPRQNSYPVAAAQAKLGLAQLEFDMKSRLLQADPAREPEWKRAKAELDLAKARVKQLQRSEIAVPAALPAVALALLALATGLLARRRRHIRHQQGDCPS
jgi:hypothetical protein